MERIKYNRKAIFMVKQMKLLRNLLARKKANNAPHLLTPAMQEERIRSSLASKGMSAREVDAAVARWRKERAEMGFDKQ